MDVLHDAAAYKARRRGKKRWQSVVAGLAAVVVFCTTYALILPAVTKEQETFCGKQEHQHGEACYGTALVCDKEYDEAPAEGHIHDESCYEWQEVLVCREPEREDSWHEHDEACYDEDGNLVCTEPEFVEGHTHTEACYEEAQVLICGEEEAQTELVPHHHTQACYQREFTCTLEEHTHSAICYSDRSADLESAAMWEATLSALTGKTPGENVALVAQSQIGYTQSERNFDVDDMGGRHGYTRYGAWYGYPYGEWCAMFASFCLHYAGISQNEFPYASGCVYWVEKLQDAGLYQRADEASPKRGDLVFFDTDMDGVSDHVGVIAAVRGEKLETVEGNISGAVVSRRHGLSDDDVLGFGAVPQSLDETPAGREDEVPGADDTDEKMPDEEAPDAEVTDEEKPDADAADEDLPDDEKPDEEAPDGEKTREPLCGLTEHTHTDDCIDADGTLLCGLEAHVHTDACYAQEEKSACGCYEEDPRLRGRLRLRVSRRRGL